MISKPDTSSHPLLKDLNHQQKEAVLHFEGPALVLAGAGSGKTRTVVQRIAYLMSEQSIYPDEILAVTFTNKAASELKERVGSLMGESARDLWVSTFHSACLRILRIYGEAVDLTPGFVIYDDSDQLDLLKEIIASIDGLRETNPRVLRSLIDKAKSNLWTPEVFLQQADNVSGKILGTSIAFLAEGYKTYQRRLKQANAVDFNDILGHTVKLFDSHPEVLEKVQERAKFIHIDEYQDTNAVQYKLTKQLASGLGNLMVVGDPDQCLPLGTRIYTPKGCISIEGLQVGNEVLATGGGKELTTGKITYIKQGHFKGNLWQIKADQHILRGTPHHITLARNVPQENRFYVYLMYRKDRGYRIGYTKGLRRGDEGKEQPGFIVRMNQEHADKLWILCSCNDIPTAKYWEAFFAAKYNLPTKSFSFLGSAWERHTETLCVVPAKDAEHPRYVFPSRAWEQVGEVDELDTTPNTKQLLLDLSLHSDFPHHHSLNDLVNLIMYQDFRHGEIGYHRVQWSSVRKNIAMCLENAGYPVRHDGRGGYCIEVSQKSYLEALEFTKGVSEVGNLAINRKAQVNGKVYQLTPLSHLHSGMKVLVEKNRQLVEVPVDEVTQIAYDGPVFDLEVDPTHTYLAEGMLVHNSVYSFRGADVRNILDFQQDYPKATVYRLELNYRSVGSVLNVANAVITHNEARLDKVLKPVKGLGESVKIYHAKDSRAEADFVARQIENLMAKNDYRYDDFAVLYRTNAQSRVLEDALRRKDIPNKIVGGVGFYDRREVKDILSYIRAAINPADDISWRRILNRPKRGIGKTSESKLLSWAEFNGYSFSYTLSQATEVLQGSATAKRIAEFLELMADFNEMAQTKPAKEFLAAVIDQSGYKQALKDEDNAEAQARLENLNELFNAVSEWQEEVGGNIEEFLDEASLLASIDDRAVRANNKNKELDETVTLMTLHNAKGLEFPVVFLVGLEENLIPHRSSLSSLPEIEEERRLLYVGITRAKEELLLVHCETRQAFGNTEHMRPSRFLEGVPKEMLPEIDIFGRFLELSKLNKYDSTIWNLPSREIKNQKQEISFRGGEKVEHPRFGKGTVLGISGSGEKREVTVSFTKAGVKKLMLKYANLRTLD